MSGLMEVAAESAVQAQAPSGARDLAGSAADSVALRADVPPPLRALRLCQIQEHCLPAVFSNPCSRQRRQHLQDTQYLKLSLLITSRGSRGRNAANSGKLSRLASLSCDAVYFCSFAALCTRCIWRMKCTSHWPNPAGPAFSRPRLRTQGIAALPFDDNVSSLLHNHCTLYEILWELGASYWNLNQIITYGIRNYYVLLRRAHLSKYTQPGHVGSD